MSLRVSARAWVIVWVSGMALGAAPADGPPLEELLERAGKYAQRYEAEFTDMAAEEAYTQRLYRSRGMGLQQLRSLKSDMVFVKFAGDLKWMGFRDVFEVDGDPVRERKARIEPLLQKAGAAAYGRAQQILDESARYNLGRTRRNFNLPTLAFVFLHPANQSRFKFQRHGKDTVDGAVVWEISYEEKARPAFIRDAKNNDLFSKGRLWVEEEEGRLVRSELYVQDAERTYEVALTAKFAPWREGGVWVPAEMQETCAFVPPDADRMPAMRGSGVGALLSNATGEEGEYVETLATYSNYRRFKVETTETLQDPRPAPTP